MRERILVLAAQVAIRAALARTLVPLGYGVEVASSERTARQLTNKKRFAAAIVAARSGTTDDFALIERLRNAVDKLILVADDAGAPERLVRAFPEALVCAAQQLDREKLCAFLGNPAQKAYAPAVAGKAELLRFADRTLDVAGRSFRDATGREVALTRGEFALLVSFARNPGRALSRAHLRNSMDGGSVDADDRSIDMLVARLRRKIEPEPARPQFIITVPGVGYKFVAGVHGETAVAVVAASPAQPSAAHAAPRAERRQVTVLSCQILGVAALAARLDPEDLDAAIGPVYAACAEVIGRFGGTMARALGDGVLAYFGHPSAHEDDAARAVRAALELLHAVSAVEMAPTGNFRARIGVATGMMVVGELSSMGGRDAGGVGEALNLALHLQQAAPAGSVVIAAATRALIGNFFQCREIAPIEMEEAQQPVPAWRIVGEVAGMPRFEALRRDGMLDLVGREAEMERLRQCWSKARGGSGQVALLTGEAGIGKSRLLVELQESVCGEPHATIRWSGSPHSVDAPMAVLIDEIQSAAGFAKSDSSQQKVKKICSIFDPHGRSEGEATALIARLLGLPSTASPEINELAPQKRKERTFAALLARIEAMTLQQPVCAVVEDIHWADPTSLEFIALLVERSATLHLLLIIVARPEFVPPWPEHSHVATLSLSRLSRSDAALLIHQVVGERRLAPGVEADILARADGVPLFVEELTKAVLESSAGVVKGGDGVDGATPPALSAGAEQIPSTLQGLLLARFDRLDRGRAVAQAGAVIGREFSFELLCLVAGMDEPTLLGALDQLVASGLVFRRGTPPQATYVFKHALVRDAAHGRLARVERRNLHAKVAHALEASFPEITQAQPKLLAYHFREAGDPIKSLGYLLAAAEAALLRSASTEALSLVAQARELTAALPEGRGLMQLELKLEITLARGLLATRGYTAPETRAAYRRARRCCEVLSDETWLPLIIHGQWLGAWIAADHRSALEEARQLYSWGERNNDPVGLAEGHSDLGMTLTTLGELTQARRHLDEALRINKFVLPGRQPFVASDVDGRISALSFMHNCLLLLGFPDQAEAAADEAAALRPNNLYSQGLAQTRLVRVRVFARDARATVEGGRELLRLAEQQGYPYFVATANIYLGWAAAQRSESADGIESCQKGLAQLQAIGAKCWLPFHLALLAECYERAGDNAGATAAVSEALEAVEATGERLWHAEILRLKGRLLHARADAAAAQVCFVEALRVARQQGAKLLELRAASSLAALVQGADNWVHARDCLAAVYSSFTEGFDFIDLREAKALVDGSPRFDLITNGETLALPNSLTPRPSSGIGRRSPSRCSRSRRPSPR